MESTPAAGDPRVLRGSRSPAQPGVSIIVLVTTDTSRLRACLESIDAHLPAERITELLVVANGTPPEQLSWLAGRDDVVLLASTVNLGFGGGCNWAAGVARGERLLFLNDDVVVTPGWLEALDEAMTADPAIGIAGSRVALASGALQEAGGVIWRDGTTSGVGRGLDPGAPEYLIQRDVDYVSFCSAMVARRAWEEAGGFDDRYFPAYYEDTDLCLSVAQLGWRVVCVPRSLVIHDEGASTSQRFSRFLKSRNRARFAARWRQFLAGCEPPPSLASGQRAVVRALDRAALRARESTAAPAPHADGGGRRPGATSAAATPADVAAIELAALRRLRALDEEYIAHLTREIDGAGPVTLARSRYRAMRALGGRLLIRHPRLGRLVRSVVVSVGNRD